MAWQDVATQLLGAQAPAVINRLQSINPSYDWSGVIQQYVPALNQAYGSDWQDPSRGSSEGLVSALLTNAQNDGQGWAASQLPAQQQRQQAQQGDIQKAQNPPSKGLFGDLGGLAQLAALIPGPQQPFLLAANAANSLSKGNIVGAGLNAFGAYNGGIGNAWDSVSGAFSGAGEGSSSLPAMDDWNYGLGSQGNGQLSGLTQAQADNIRANPSKGYDFSGGGGMTLSDPWGAGTPDPSLGTGDLSVPSYGGNVMDQFPVSGVGGSGAALPSGWQAALGVPGAGSLNGVDYSFWNSVPNAVKSMLPGGGGTPGSGSGVGGVGGSGNGNDLLSILGRAAPGLLGAFASSKQADTLKGIADEYKAFGAPSRARYESSFAPGFSMASDPGFTDALDQSAKATLHGLSVNGNPAGSPNAWAATLDDLYKKNAYPALQQYRGQNAATSGIANFNAAAPGAQTGQLQANANIFNGIGSAIGNVTNPAPTLADIMKQFGQLSGGNSIFRTA